MKKKVLIGIKDIGDQGGISTSIINLLNQICQRYEITLLVLSGFISNKVIIPPNIKLIYGPQSVQDLLVNRKVVECLSLPRKCQRIIRRVIKRIVGVRKAISWGLKGWNLPDKYDVAIAFSGDIFHSDGSMMTGGLYETIIHHIQADLKVAWIHNKPQEEGLSRDICLNLFHDYDKVVNVSNDCKAIFDNIVPEFSHKSYVVYNTYNIDRIVQLANEYSNPYEHNGKIHFVTVARLRNYQKRIDRILNVAHQLLERKIDNFDWTIVGEGDSYEELITLQHKFHLQDVVKFVGLKSNPYPYMKYADAFVLPSQYEGFGMTIKEAQILKCPTIVTNFGPASEAVENGKQGMICENSTVGLYTIISELLLNPQRLYLFRNYLNNNPVDNKIALKQFDLICS